MEILQKHKKWLSVVLSFAGIGLVFFYAVCGESCSYLRGALFGIDLKYAGILFMAALIVLALARQEHLLLVAVAAATGAEIFLVGFQIRNETFCPYCLMFGVTVLLLFLLNLDPSRKKLAGFSLVLGFFLFWIFFEGSVIPTYAAL
jgi:uncharacterized membrane protein